MCGHHSYYNPDKEEPKKLTFEEWFEITYGPGCNPEEDHVTASYLECWKAAQENK